MRTVGRLVAGVSALGFAIAIPLGAQGRQANPPPTPAAPAAADSVAVTVRYSGKGTVDATHPILVFLFAEPTVGPQSRPIGPPQIAQKNGATLTFTNVTTKPVYVFAVYADKGGYDGRSGPPAAGTPIGMYRRNAQTAPIAVTPGPKTAIRLTFTDALRWGSD